MEYEFSSRFSNISKSLIREMLVRASGDDMINFSPGFPDARSFPIEEITKISNDLLKEDPLKLLQYARGTIFPELKEALSKFYNRVETIVTDLDDITVTSGSGEGLEMSAKVFCNEGDFVVVEDPSYVGALNGFKSNGCQLIGVEMDDCGLIPSKLEEAFQHNPKPKMLYTIPTFQNPTTICTPLSRRKEIYDLCVKYNIMIIEDDPYSALRYKGQYIPTYKSMDSQGIVVYLSSLSKVVSPGIRLGSVIARKEVVDKYIAIKGASAGACTSWSQLVIARFLSTADIDAHLSRLSSLYKEKCDVMYESMVESFHKDVTITKPDGGMFIWFKLPDYANEEEFIDLAVSHHIALVPELAFATNDRALKGFRLSYTSESNETIKKGIKMLGDYTHQVCNG